MCQASLDLRIRCVFHYSILSHCFSSEYVSVNTPQAKKVGEKYLALTAREREEYNDIARSSMAQNKDKKMARFKE